MYIKIAQKFQKSTIRLSVERQKSNFIFDIKIRIFAWNTVITDIFGIGRIFLMNFLTIKLDVLWKHGENINDRNISSNFLIKRRNFIRSNIGVNESYYYLKSRVSLCDERALCKKLCMDFNENFSKIQLGGIYGKIFPKAIFEDFMSLRCYTRYTLLNKFL